ncbi:tetratricopeptide repeat protein [Carboxylicivirga mesophila]|uniref:Tetratricopeptide repeat protein n=1 Tax=Carboxylicivirga mesophila TaxID=1166478 RepID=A0ABS5KGD4_9BACT|nr:tetratricopeptide repeat protein [Carboxylicivirga mesophila]MBS2213862.1 tetratricopeptide repeat protein [Carboxylicivirga mesophila]
MKKLLPYSINVWLYLCIYALSQHNVLANDIVREDSLTFKLEQSQNTNERLAILLELVKLTRKYDLKKSLLFGTQGEQIALSKEREEWLPEFQLENGSSNYFLGNYDEALENYLNAIENYTKIENNVGLIRSFNNTGMIYDRIENYPKSINYYRQALHYFGLCTEKEKEQYKRYQSQIYNNIASANLSLGNRKEAKVYYEKALDVAKEIGFRHIIGSIYNNLGKIEIIEQDYPTAYRYLNKAIKIRQEDNELEGLAKSYYFLSNYYSNINELDSAEWAARKALNIAKEINVLEPQKVAHMFLYEIYESKGLLKEALEEHKNYKLISDSLINEQKVNQLSQLQISYEVDKIEEANKLEKSRIRSFYTLLITILSATLLIAILLMIIFKMQKRKVDLENTKLEMEVETKNRELTTNVMYLVQKNELLNNVAKKLINLKDNLKDANKKPLQQIIYNLQSQSDNEVWQEFQLRFNQVHNDFYERIRAKHPEITPSEERLCALLRLNMTSKEIAAITHQTLRGVEVARGRLRKRLDLTGTDINLITYLEGF